MQYDRSGNLTLKVNGTVISTTAGATNFDLVPRRIIWGGNQTAENQYDAVFPPITSTEGIISKGGLNKSADTYALTKSGSEYKAYYSPILLAQAVVAEYFKSKNAQDWYLVIFSDFIKDYVSLTEQQNEMSLDYEAGKEFKSKILFNLILTQNNKYRIRVDKAINTFC